MKKNIIWLLTVVMAITFGALLYFQIIYLENMVKMRESQFSEIVMRCLSATSNYLEKNEAFYFLQDDMDILGSNLMNQQASLLEPSDIPGNGLNLTVSPELASTTIKIPSTVDNVTKRYRDMQEIIRSQYLYQKSLLNEVILSILRDSGNRSVYERADSTVIRAFLKSELNANGLDLPFTFAVTNPNDLILYSTVGYNPALHKGIYSQTLFPNTDNQLKLNIEFPTKNNYIFSSVRFIIPALAFSLMLLIVFLFTILLAFRQKKLSEMKTDFINNMTHELKTPISTISLAAQMLGDDSVRKSSSSLSHLSNVILDESKRLRFQVEKVLQMSVFDDSSSTLKFTVLDANDVILNVVRTFAIKVEKYGGKLTCNLTAANSNVNVDEMHFTNIIYNLLDNAVKYMREDVSPQLNITTREITDDKLEIIVKDNGIGIKKEDMKRIFEKFYRVPTKNRHDVKGFGLGLAYVKKMISLFRGTIRVESELGTGSEFIITLPLEKE